MSKMPVGELTIQTLAMPMDTNANGDIFGGWIVAQMDLAMGILAKRVSKGRIVTVAINSMTFLKPVHVGCVVSCYVTLVKVGNSSMTMNVEVWAMPPDQQEVYQVTKGTFVAVAVDEQGKPRKVMQA
ncbi:MAG: acyl-CoA thioesterase [Legionella sp.]|nr:MAG: acyl-CoA thioesterase [Legionella sp.]PJD97348.1 MAG: acyl-CoA thioesterase [Legionella sp.]